MSSNNVNIADEIKSRCNIVDVIGRVVSLKKTGNNYKGICPFHRYSRVSAAERREMSSNL